MNQIVIRPEELGQAGDVVLTGRRAVHLRQVLRKAPGEQVRVGLPGGGRGAGAVRDLAADGSVTLRCTFDLPALPSTGITLVLALPRPKVLRRLFAPLAAWGVETLILTNAAKVERVYFDTHWLQPEQYEPLLLEGLEQSGETRLPEVRVVRRLKPLVEDELSAWPGTRLLLHPADDARRVTQAALARPILVAIGPEGGWTDYEVALFRAHGFTCMTLGPRILRSDIAVHGAMGILNSLLSEGEANG